MTWDIPNKEKHSYEWEATNYTLANGYISVRGTRFLRSFQHEAFLSGSFVSSNNGKSLPVIPLSRDPVLHIRKTRTAYSRIDLSRQNSKESCNSNLDMLRGCLSTKYDFYDDSPIKSIEEQLYVSRHTRNVILQQITIDRRDLSGELLVEIPIRTQALSNSLEPESSQSLIDSPTLHLSPFESSLEFELSLESAIRLEDSITFCGAQPSEANQREGTAPASIFHFESDRNAKIVIKRIIRLQTVNTGSSESFRAAHNDFDRELSRHIQEMEIFWSNNDITIDGDRDAQRAIRFNIFHLSSYYYFHDRSYSIGAKGLHGEGYRAHVFWDTEIYLLPYLAYTSPDAAKDIIMYRYDRLDAARRRASGSGFKGAWYPWESADSGDEETPLYGRNYKNEVVRIYTGEMEYHIGAAIVYSIYTYFEITGDRDLLYSQGLEIIYEVIAFYHSLYQYNERDGKYHLSRVIGPDEFHEDVSDNFYTNFLVKWAVQYFLSIYDEAIKSKASIHPCPMISKIEKDALSDFAEKVFLGRRDGDVIEQFSDFFALQDPKISEWDDNSMPKWPKDIDTTRLGDYQLLKQPDVVMAQYLLPSEFTSEEIRHNFEYYESRTMHKSSLSASIHAIVGCRIGEAADAYLYFMRTALTDLEDNQGNSLLGIHAAATGGTWLTIIQGLLGITSINDHLAAKPTLPEHWNSVSIQIWFRGHRYSVVADKTSVQITKV
jgi:kojibiose phosphorylase